MTEFIMNISALFDCENLITRVEIEQGFKTELIDEECISYEVIEESIKNQIPDNKKLISDDHSYWKDLLNCDYNWNTIRWQHFNLNDSFNDIVEKISNLLKMRMLRCFVTRLDPGYVVPYHWDLCDVNLRTENNLDKIFRYTCFLNSPNIGSIFIVDDKCFYNEKQGDLYKWNHYTNFHGAFNIDATPHYLFHFIGTTDEY